MDGGFVFAVVVQTDFEGLALAVVAGVADEDGVLLAVDEAGKAFAVGEVAGAEGRGHDRAGGRRSPLARPPLFFFFGFRYRSIVWLQRRLLGLLAALAQHLSDLVDSGARQHFEPPFFFAVIRSFGEEPFFGFGVRLHEGLSAAGSP